MLAYMKMKWSLHKSWCWHSCAKKAREDRERFEAEQQRQKDLHNIEMDKKRAEIDRERKEAEFEEMQRRRKEELLWAQHEVAMDKEKRMVAIEVNAAQKKAEYQAALQVVHCLQEDEIQQKKMERKLQELDQQMKVKTEQQKLEIEKKEREIDLDIKKMQGDLDLRLKEKDSEQARKFKEVAHAQDLQMKWKQQEFDQRMQQYTAERKMAIEEDFSKRMAFTLKATAPNSGNELTLRASDTCNKDVLQVLLGVLQRPVLENIPKEQDVDDQTERAAGLSTEMQTIRRSCKWTILIELTQYYIDKIRLLGMPHSLLAWLHVIPIVSVVG